MPAAIDVVSTMLMPSWRGIEFHTAGWRFGFKQDQAVHKPTGRDGAIVEGVGRGEATYSFTALFKNGITGSKGLLYPTRWREFVRACADKSSGPLVHPELGEVRVKCVSQMTVCDVNNDRSGVTVDLEFVESNDRSGDLDDILGQASPTGSAFSAATDLTDACSAIKPALPKLPSGLSPSPLEALKKITGTIARVKTGIGSITGQINAYQGGLIELREQIETADTPSQQHMKALAAVQALFGATVDLAATVTKKSRPVVPAYVQTEATIDAVAGFFSMSLDDFLDMNPSVASKTRIIAGREVYVFR